MSPTTAASDRLGELIDVHDIEQLLHRYAVAIDTIDLDLFDEIFHAGAHIEVAGRRHDGRDAYRAVCADVLPKLDATQHCMLNTTVRVDGDMAAARTYYVAQHVRNELAPDSFFLSAGWNDDELRKEHGRWLIVRRHATRLWWSGNPRVIWQDVAPHGGRRPAADGWWRRAVLGTTTTAEVRS